jgi:hypothetical protein
MARIEAKRVSTYLLLALGARATPALAEPSAEPPSPARVLFDEGREAMAAGNLLEGCRKLEASLALEPGVGTQFHLASCWEQVGRTASAHELFLRAMAAAEAMGQAERVRVLQERAAAIEPRLSRLTVDVSTDGTSLSVTREGTPIPPEHWGQALPLDPGSYEVCASAKGKQSWCTRAQVGPEAARVSVVIPALEPAPQPLPQVQPRATRTTPPPTVPAHTALSTSEDSAPASLAPSSRVVALGWLSLVGLGMGAATGLTYKVANDGAKALCPSNRGCTDREIADHARLVERARSNRTWSYAASSVGAAGLTAAAVLYWWELSETKKSEKRLRALPAVDLHGELTLELEGAF